MNKKILLTAVFVTSAVGHCGSMFAQRQTMKLQEIYNLADQQSQRIRVSEVGLKSASEAVLSAKSALLPNLNLSLSGSYIGNATMMSRGFSTSGTSDIIVAGLGPQAVPNGKQDTPHWGNTFTAQATQVIYAGGAIRSGIKIAELGEQMATLDIEKNRQEVRFLLTGYYLDLYKLTNQIDVIDKNIELTKKVIENMNARKEQGTVLKNDITRYELQLKNLELTKVQLQDAMSIMNHQLLTTLHMPEGTVITPDEAELKSEIATLQSVASEDDWQRTASSNNIDLKQASLATEIANQQIKQSRAASLPSVAVVMEDNLFGPYTNDLIPTNANVNAWFIGLGVKYSLSSLWNNKHNIRKAKFDSQKSHETLSLAHEGIENGVQANYVNLLTSFKEVSTQEKQVELANQNYDVVQNRYNNQLALLTDMLDASSMKLSADMALVNARITLLYNYYKLKYVANTL